jgi:hypothetical protein
MVEVGYFRLAACAVRIVMVLFFVAEDLRRHTRAQPARLWLLVDGKASANVRKRSARLISRVRKLT